MTDQAGAAAMPIDSEQGGACGAYAAAAATGADVQEVFTFAGHAGQDRPFSLVEISGFLASKGYCLLQAAMFSTPEYSTEGTDAPAPLAVDPDQARRLRLLADRQGASPGDLLHGLIEGYLAGNGLPVSAEETPPPTWGENGAEVKRRGVVTGFCTRVGLVNQPGLVFVTAERDLHYLYWDGCELLDPASPPGRQLTHWHKHRVVGFIPVCKLGQ